MRPGRAAALLMAAALVLSSCGAGGGGGSDEPVGDPRPGGSLVWQLPAEVSTDLNPLESSDPSATGLISGSVYGKLLDWRTGPDVTEMELEGDLAESWEVSEDGLTYTFHLRRDVTWHDVEPVNGRPFVADDVVATITAMKERGLQAYMLEAVRTVQAPDEHTVVLTLDRPFAPLLEYVAYHTFLMVPREGIEGRYDLDTVAIGTGPFLLAEHTPDVEWVLRRNPDYHVPDRPYLDEVRRPVINDTAATTAALRSGRLDVGTTSDVTVADEFRDGDHTVTETPGAPVSFYLNPRVEPFDDVRVRRAVSLAIDWEGMGETVRGSFNLTSILRPDVSDAALSEDEVREIRPFDSEQARRLLAEAGLPDGFATTLLVQRVDDEDVREAQWMQADLAEVGIDVTIETVDPGTGIERRRTHEFAMTKALRTVHLPDQTWRDFMPGYIENYALVDDPELVEGYARTRTTTDDAERRELHRAMQRRMETEIVQGLFPIQKFDYTILSSRTRDLFPVPIHQGRRLADVWLSDQPASP
ncbi:ABC transporter substrate-binding protein [Pseudonocardia sp. DR1-2]|uniref:ABC transporter substrate-binding protein n=1 Tax=Pseudonocardia sp. DR1-2 TaxID=2951168 RepID=UPI0020443FF4|nr:ABC transporter substrate-binding protein [Pseudonocardia sp. DR1-2]MCM3847321.1 ABC transporter substrate-binding protein [Pseudonocardia sp. DR1-2]